MPTYEYQCQKCGREFEVSQSIKADPLKMCPAQICTDEEGKGAVKRLISAGGGLLFKGSGFYITDYRSESYKKAEKADSKSAGNSADGGEKSSKSSKSESSPAPTAEKA